jgi:apolipoprotein N-acyltransferase
MHSLWFSVEILSDFIHAKVETIAMNKATFMIGFYFEIINYLFHFPWLVPFLRHFGDKFNLYKVCRKFFFFLKI